MPTAARLVPLLATLAGLFMLSFPASGQDLDLKSRMLMPGPLIEAHAEEEKNCSSCHSSFDKGAQDSLCLDCHEKVAEDRAASTGFHGRSAQAVKGPCKTCHSDHRGRDFQNVLLDPESFSHDNTDFPLRQRHAPLACDSCHEPGKLFRETPGACVDCHGDEDPHNRALGDACDGCHQPSGWRDRKTFDHSTTDFPLRGKHEPLACVSCHAGEQYEFESTACVSCHRLEDPHLGSRGERCDRCHSEDGWKEAAFDHGRETDFDLTGAHRNQSCGACHLQNLNEAPPGKDCYSCHQGVDVHAGRNGKQCDSCHGTDAWAVENFDHRIKAGWPLEGKHRGLSCLQCHRGHVEEGQGDECISCHREDDAHQSVNLEYCAACHEPRGWDSLRGFDHELTRFPLEGMHAIVSCQSCHETHRFDQADEGCADCHGEDDAHDGGLGENCGLCHSPNGWQIWNFDHGRETGFALEYAHAEVTCASCHRGGRASDVASNCGGCHRGDDRHEGNFGPDCSRCHNTKSFGDIRWPD